METKTILHVDMNNFFASVECLYDPGLRSKPMAVCGDPSLRHGIVLAKNGPAKSTGIITGLAIWQAKQLCPSLIVLPPNYSLYLRFARMARRIYTDYATQIEPFGLDEAWLDVTDSLKIIGSGRQIADKIRSRIKFELGITASVGVSFNKIFAKLGSDMKKPDATTLITKEKYKETVWPLPVQDLLYVGRAARKKLNRKNILTIGDLAQSNVQDLTASLGKWGRVLHDFANGLDCSPVANFGEESIIKSIGNSTTTPRDLKNEEDVMIVLYVLAESVAARLREHGFKCATVQIHIRDNSLVSFERQGKLQVPSAISFEIASKAISIFHHQYAFKKPVRTLGLRCCDLVPFSADAQTNLFTNAEQRQKMEKLERTLDALRRRYGYYCLQRAVLLKDRPLHINPKEDHIIHPVGFFNQPRGV